MRKTTSYTHASDIIQVPPKYTGNMDFSKGSLVAVLGMGNSLLPGGDRNWVLALEEDVPPRLRGLSAPTLGRGSEACLE
jgi:hypothetical protein